MAKEISENSLNEIIGGMDPETLKKVAYGAGLVALGAATGVGGKILYDNKFSGPAEDELDAVNEILRSKRSKANSDGAKNEYNKLLGIIQTYIPGIVTTSDTEKFEIKQV